MKTITINLVCFIIPEVNPILNEASLTLNHDGGGERVRGFIGNGIYLGNDETNQVNGYCLCLAL